LSSEHGERRLAAILVADVAGSCRLIAIDEEGTLAQLKALRKTLFDPKITDHRGRIVKNTGTALSFPWCGEPLIYRKGAPPAKAHRFQNGASR
jgi:class 3 adenylate cyclase